MGSRDWIDLARDAETGIEALRAHFEGHAYDPHWHDSYLIGYTEIGVQQFNCRRRRHDSTAGQVFLVEPGRSTTVARRSPAASPTRCCTCSRTGCGANCGRPSTMRPATATPASTPTSPKTRA
ncbi:AraC family ligand binding domain-containing protein [Pseudomonas aeruginosa]|nr:AraC family ligand binding domain-containing protein [Pseudomonas aeruginosa]